MLVEEQKIPIAINDLTFAIIGCAFKVHKALGPGLPESSYEACLFYELMEAGFKVERQKELPLIYNEIKLDLVINDSVIIEIKAVEEIAQIHKAQILTYLKLSKIKIGLLINFNTTDLKQGIYRLAM